MRVNRHAAAAGVLAAGLLVAGAPALAQSELGALSDRLNRLERDLSSLQRQVYRGGGGGSGSTTVITSPALGGGGGGAGAGYAEPLPGDAAARIEVRLGQLEETLRDLTGQVEENRFKVEQIGGRLDRLSADIDLRLRDIEQRLGPAPIAGEPGASGAEGTGVPPGVAAAVPPGAAPAGILGTMPQKELDRALAQGGGQTPPAAQPGPAALKGDTPKDQYEYAFNLIRSDYAAAEQALKAFVEAHPKDPLAGNAQYWLGETYYVRGDYQNAAVAFLQGYQKYPKNPKAPDSLLKLALSLNALGQKKEACAAFARLAGEYPQAPDNVKRRASAERQKIGCK